MKKALERQENLNIKQDEICEVIVDNNKITGVITRLGNRYDAKAVIIAGVLILTVRFMWVTVLIQEDLTM